jgi:hypothetical protein
VAWVRDERESHGLFVELHDSDRSLLERDLHSTLASMQRSRGVELGPVHAEIVSACSDG